MDKIKWFIYKWIKRYCPHFCLFCKYRKRCEYDRQTIFNEKKPP